MPLFGKYRDISMFRHINRELMDKMISTEVGYYKQDISKSSTDIYGDTVTRKWYDPVLITCLIERGEQITSKETYGTDTTRIISFKFLRDELMNIQLVPEKGDAIMWNESYYEVDNVVTNQLFVGKDPDYSVQDPLQDFGRSWSIICSTHLANVNKLNIIKPR